MPPDMDEVQNIVNIFEKQLEKYKKKRDGEEEYEEDVQLDIDWALYMVCAREMGMSEEEFYHSSPIFFDECYRIFKERKEQEVNSIWRMN